MKSKIIMILMVFLLGSNAIAQLPRNEKNGKVEYTEVVQVEGISKDEIFKKAKLWMVSTLKSGDNMIELSGDESDRIVGTGIIQLDDIPITTNIWKTKETFLSFKFIILCKEERYKYEVSNFTLKYFYLHSNQPFTASSGLEEIEVPKYLKNKDKKKAKFRENVNSQVISNINALIKDLKANLQLKSEDDW